VAVAVVLESGHLQGQWLAQGWMRPP